MNKDKIKQYFNYSDIKKLINENNFLEVILRTYDYDVNCSDVVNLLLEAKVPFIETLVATPFRLFSNTNIGSIFSLPNNIERIGDETFAEAKNLEIFIYDIDSKCDIIGQSAFYGCSNLRIVDLPNDIKILSEEVFAEDYNLTSISLPNNLELISFNAFENCKRLKRIRLPKNLQLFTRIHL